jgi:hypothetical protein
MQSAAAGYQKSVCTGDTHNQLGVTLNRIGISLNAAPYLVFNTDVYRQRSQIQPSKEKPLDSIRMENRRSCFGQW